MIFASQISACSIWSICKATVDISCSQFYVMESPVGERKMNELLWSSRISTKDITHDSAN
jgi:hypothetical protein